MWWIFLLSFALTTIVLLLPKFQKKTDADSSTHSKKSGNARVFKNASDDWDDDDEDIDEEQLLDAALTSLALHHTFKKDKKKNKNNDYDWKTHCEYCGELLEDCQCDHRHTSRRDSGFSVYDDDDEDDRSHFDDFRSF